MLKKDKVTPAWGEGIFPGLLWMSSEYIIDTRYGVMRAHSVKRTPSEACWDIGMVR